MKDKGKKKKIETEESDLDEEAEEEIEDEIEDIGAPSADGEKDDDKGNQTLSRSERLSHDGNVSQASINSSKKQNKNLQSRRRVKIFVVHF